jgi:hypothetical protein
MVGKLPCGRFAPFLLGGKGQVLQYGVIVACHSKMKYFVGSVEDFATALITALVAKSSKSLCAVFRMHEEIFWYSLTVILLFLIRLSHCYFLAFIKSGFDYLSKKIVLLDQLLPFVLNFFHLCVKANHKIFQP